MKQAVLWVVCLHISNAFLTTSKLSSLSSSHPRGQVGATSFPRLGHSATEDLVTGPDLEVAAGGKGEQAPPRKVDRKWQKKRKTVKLGPDGLPIGTVHAPRVERRSTQGRALELGMINPSRLRIMGGVARGKRLDSPEVQLRPMMGKVRAAMYSTLESVGLFSSQKPIRVCVGLEALSRGAAEGVFVDLAEDCCQVALRNAGWCGFEGKAKAVLARAEEVLRHPERYGVSAAPAFDLISITPPYEEVVYSELIADAMNSPLVAEDTLVVIEYPIELGSLPFNIGEGRLLGLRNRRYGRTVLAIYAVRPTGRFSGELRPEEFEQIVQERTEGEGGNIDASRTMQ